MKIGSENDFVTSFRGNVLPKAIFFEIHHPTIMVQTFIRNSSKGHHFIRSIQKIGLALNFGIGHQVIEIIHYWIYFFGQTTTTRWKQHHIGFDICCIQQVYQGHIDFSSSAFSIIKSLSNSGFPVAPVFFIPGVMLLYKFEYVFGLGHGICFLKKTFRNITLKESFFG